MFQPKYTVGIDWGAPREQVSLAVVRSTRHMVSLLPQLQDKFVRIIKNELDRAVGEHCKGASDWSRVPIFSAMERTFTRVSTQMLLGESTGQQATYA